MSDASLFAGAGRRCLIAVAVVLGVLLPAPSANAQDAGTKILIYTGTTGFRHTDGINNGRPVVQNALRALGYTVDWEDCTDNGGAPNNCDNPDKNARIFSDANLAQYDAILFLNASWSWAGGGKPGPLLAQPQRDAIIRYVQNGGGIAAVHNSTDMGAGQSVWDWWDGGQNSMIGTTMPGHSPGSSTNNPATVQVADRNHLSTRDLPDSYQIADEHYNYLRNVRGDHHVLATFDERTYNTGTFSMGQDHPVSWCKLYQGESVDDGTGNPKPYTDGRTWNTGMGHFGARYTEANARLVKHIVGGVRWVAGGGKKTDCSGTVWANFKRTILVSDVNGPMGLDVAADGKVYWTEIGPTQGYESQGFVKLHNPAGPPNNKTTVAAIPTRADHGNSEDGVLGMSLEPGFDLSNPSKRHIYVYYSPRNPAWPTSGDNQIVGYNLVSRFTLNKAGTAFELAKGSAANDPAHPFAEEQILRVPKAKITGSPSGFTGGPRDSGPGHVGGAGLDFDSQGNLYLGVGDDVSPNAPGHNRYAPMDYRSSERWDARKTAANTADLRGKVLRIRPLANIQSNVEPGLGKSYTVPTGNMFPQGMANTRPEIYAMGFRQPFTVHTDPANPGAVVVGEFCHDNSVDQADRSPAGVCEWNLVDKPGFHGWPFCVGDNSSINTTWRWNYGNNTSTGQQYNCALQDLPSDLDWAPPGQTGAPPTFAGRATIPGPATPATVWKKYPNNAGSPNPLDFGDFSTGGMQPVTGPVYRYKAGSGPGAFPEYFDGSWLITNRGTDNGFWKEVRLRQDTNHMLRVNDWLPYNNFGTPNNSFVIPTQFGPDGALYMARWSFGCCRNQLARKARRSSSRSSSAHRRVHRRRPGADGLAPDRGHARTGRAEHLPQLGHAQPDLGRRRLLGRGHDRVPGQRRRLDQLHGARPVRERWDLHGRVPGDRQRRERLGAAEHDVHGARRAHRAACDLHHVRQGHGLGSQSLRDRLRRHRHMALRPAGRAVPARRLGRAAGRQPGPGRPRHHPVTSGPSRREARRSRARSTPRGPGSSSAGSTPASPAGSGAAWSALCRWRHGQAQAGGRVTPSGRFGRPNRPPVTWSGPRTRSQVSAAPRSGRPAERAPVGLGRRRRVEARAGVVEEGVVGLGEREYLVVQVSRLERRLGSVARLVDTVVQAAVDAEHGSLRAAHVAALGERPVERRRGGQPRLAGGEQPPTIPPPKQNPIAARRRDPNRALSSATPACMSCTNRSGAIAASAAAIAASSGKEAVPPSSDSRSIASASSRPPRAGRRPSGCGRSGPGSRGSRERRRAGAPRRPTPHQRSARPGPIDRLAGDRLPGRRRRPVADRGRCTATATRRRSGRVQQRPHRRSRDAEQPQSAHRLAPRDDPVRKVLRDSPTRYRWSSVMIASPGVSIRRAPAMVARPAPLAKPYAERAGGTTPLPASD